MEAVEMIAKVAEVAAALSTIEWRTLEQIQDVAMRSSGIAAKDVERIVRRMLSSGDAISRQHGLRFEYRMVSEAENRAMDALNPPRVD
jgi:hypothetical protein